VDPVPDPLLLRKSGSAGNRTRTFGSVGRKTEKLVTGPDGGLTPGQSGRMTVSRKVTLTLAFVVDSSLNLYRMRMVTCTSGM
jgi:hypothetical protein